MATVKVKATVVEDNTGIKSQISVLLTEQGELSAVSSLSGVFTESEKKALAYAISDECMDKNSWHSTQAGQVKDLEHNIEIFPRGFVTGLRKVLVEAND